jgi:ligand-binding sensor domain-containing protein/signal transduction histidine kinase/GAF domain-containing protein
MNRKIISLIATCLALFLPSRAQPLFFKSLSKTDGLRQNTVTAISQDRRGMIWIGTQDGLHYFDGLSITSDQSISKLHEQIITTLAPSPIEDVIWIGTEHGLFAYDYNSLRLAEISFPDSVLRRVDQIYCSNTGKIWVGCKGEYFLADSKNHKILSIALSENRRSVGIASWGEKVVYSNGKGIVVAINKNLRDTTIIPDEKISCIASGVNDSLVCGTLDGKIHILLKNHTDPFRTIQISGPISCIALDKRGDIWVGTSNRGLFHISHGDSTCESVPQIGLRDRSIQSVFVDRGNLIFVGTFSEGISFCDPRSKAFQNQFNLYDGLERKVENFFVWDLCEDKSGNIYAATKFNGIVKFDKNLRYVSNYCSASGPIYSVCADANGNIWASLDSMVVKLSSNNGKTKSIFCTYDPVTPKPIAYDKATNRIFNFRADGIVIIDPDKNSAITLSDSSISKLGVYTIYADSTNSDNLWLGTNSGFYRMNQKPLKITPMGKVIGTDGQIILNSQIKILAIEQDDTHDDILWLGTSGCGMLKYDKRSDECIAFYNKKDGLQSNKVYGIAKTAEGTIWATMPSGLARTRLNFSGQSAYYDCTAWFQGSEFNAGAICKTHDGKMVLGTSMGITRFDPQSPPVFSNSNKVSITGIFKQNQENAISARSSMEDPVQILEGEQTILVRFSKMEFGFPMLVKYYYKITDLASNEILDSNLTLGNQLILSTSFSDRLFPSRRYSLEIGATVDGKRIDPQNNATVYLDIKPPFYRTPLMFIISILILALLTGIAFRIRNRSNDRKTKKLEKKIADQYLLIEQNAKRQALVQDLITAVARKDDTYGVTSQCIADLRSFFGFSSVRLICIDYVARKLEVITEKPTHTELPTANSSLFWTDLEIMEAGFVPSSISSEDSQSRAAVDILIGEQKLSILQQIQRQSSNTVLIRIPILQRAEQQSSDPQKSTADDYALAIVEGEIPRSLVSESEMALLNLYLSNCAQPFFRASKSENRRKIQKEISRALLKSKNHTDFIGLALSELLSHLNLSKADIIIMGLNNNAFDLTTETVFQGYTELEKRQAISKRQDVSNTKEGIILRVASSKTFYYTNDVSKDPFYVSELDNIGSELALPFRYQSQEIGIINFYSEKTLSFDHLRVSVIQYIADLVAVQYVKRKFDYFITSLVLPLNVFSGIKNNGMEMISIISKYFYTDHVLLYQRQVIDGKIAYSSMTDTFQSTQSSDFGEAQTILPNEDRIKTEVFQFRKKTNSNFEFWNLAQQYTFESFIWIPLLRNDILIGFIVIFSRRRIPRLLQEDSIFLELIASKASQSLQSSTMVVAFDAINASLNRNPHQSILQEIAEIANEVLLSDFVVLYEYDEENDRFNESPHWAGKMNDFPEFQSSLMKLNQPDESSPLRHVLAKGSVWISSKYEYQEEFRLHKDPFERFLGKRSLWRRENLKAIVGLRIEQDQKPMGVIFMNFRQDQVFDDVTKLFFYSFILRASNAIVNSKYIALLQSQRDASLSQAIDAEDRMELTQRTNFFLVGRAITHDIRDRLHELAILEKNIRKTSYESFYVTQRKDFDRLFQNLTQSADNIDELLRRFRLNSFQKVWTDLHKVIDVNIKFFKFREQVLGKKNTGPQIEFGRVFENPMADIYCEPTMLSMIIYNLLSNAIKAIEDSGNNRNGKVTITTQLHKSFVQVIVEDNGVGIDFNIGDLIFEPYFSRREGGVGFGLYFVKETLRTEFNGNIFFESTVGRGTKFFIQLESK